MTRGRRHKVERLIQDYDLHGLGDELVADWTADDDRKSLRELADEFNVRLIEAAMDRNRTSTVEDDPRYLYRTLTGEETTSSQRVGARRRLERAGIDFGELEEDFVTYQAIRSYVQDVRDAEYQPPTDGERIATDRRAIQRLVNRTVSVVERKLTYLRDTDRIALGDFRFVLTAQVYCRDCGTRQTVVELLDEGGCDCDAEETA